MKKLLSFVVLLAMLSAFADAAVTRQSVRQRWPFSSKVDIDLFLDSDANSDVELTATYDGCVTPIKLTADQLEGSLNLTPGFNHLVWSPLAAGLGESKMTGFAVTATLASFDSRKFLVFDLGLRSWQYYATDPEGNAWTADKYKLRYLVFRRIPAGVYQLGYTSEQMAHLETIGATSRSSYEPGFKSRTITITKDYYLSIHQLSGGHLTAVGWYKTPGGGGAPGYYYSDKWVTVKTGASNPTSYWRGNPAQAEPACAWPQDGHAVHKPGDLGDSDDGSFIGRLRYLMATGGHDLPKNMIIDLPTQEQWEIAARAGSPLYLGGFGTVETTAAEFDEYKAAHSRVNGGEIGTKMPNEWGFYDMAGLNYESVLNAVSCTLDPGKTVSLTEVTFDEVQSIDPVGLTCAKDESLCVVICNCGWSWSGVGYSTFPPSRAVERPDTGHPTGARVCIHIK